MMNGNSSSMGKTGLNSIIKDKLHEHLNRPHLPDRLFYPKTIDAALDASRAIMNSGTGGVEDRIRSIASDLAARAHRNHSSSFELVMPEDSEIYLPSHTINVVILSLVIGSELTYSMEDLTDLAMAALLHDIGIPGLGVESINKPAQLSMNERKHIEKHPLIALSELNRWHRLPPAVKLGAYQHHEKYSGGGYPKGLRRFGIHEFARIIRIADTYEAMTAKRAYRPPVSPPKTMNFLLARANDEFDPHLVKKFLSRMSLYPPGTIVRMNTGETARVIMAHREQPYLPLVEIITDSRGNRLARSQLLDLKGQKQRIIKGCVT